MSARGNGTMIISHEHRFIFLRTRKTAGTSIDFALSTHCGPRDVISPLSDEEESEKRSAGLRSAQNYHVPVGCWTAKDFLKFGLKGRRPRYTKHMTAGSLQKRIDRSTWDGYFKFCVERNPFDKAISLYYWRTMNTDHRPDLVQFLKTVEHDDLSNFSIYAMNGRIEVDQIIRYEALESGLKTICKSLGLSLVDLPHQKSNSRTDRAHYRELMTDEARAIVERACQNEIALLDYEY